MPYFRITLIRSAIGLPRRTGDVLKALGLNRRMKTVFHAVNPSTAGQIMKVKELVSVEETEEALNARQLRLERKPDPGYYVETRAQDERSDLQGRPRGFLKQFKS